MRKILTVLLLVAFVFNSVAQKSDNKRAKKDDGFKFKKIKELKHTSVKDQKRSGTCWSFSGISFLESEILRISNKEVDLSEMFMVYHCYNEKANRYVRMHGNTNFSAGGAFHDVLYVMKKYGLVTEEAYSGLQYGESEHVHGEMDKLLRNIVDGVIENKNRKLSNAWRDVVSSTLDAYLGSLPDEFEFEGEKYNPATFAINYCEIDPDDYVQVASFNHHPFYSTFIIEIPDNWLWGSVYNVPLDNLMEIISYSIDNGYTIGWASDVSEKGFATKSKGVAVVPDVDYSEMSDADIEKWEKMTDKEKNEKLYTIDKPGKEKEITQEMRQEAFDNYQTTDDHGMHIIGTVKDQKGKKYYKVKNSWGEYNRYDGYFYASEAYLKYKTMSVMVHKDAIPAEIREKLGL